MLANIDARIRFVRMFDITNAERLKATCVQHLEILEAIGQARRWQGGRAFCDATSKAAASSAENAVKEALASAHAIYG